MAGETMTRTVWGMGTPRTLRPLWALLCEIDLPTPLGEYRDRVVSRPGFQAAMASNCPSKAAAESACDRGADE